MAIHTTPDSYTKLLIHSDTSNGSPTFVDSSTSNHTIISYGDPAHSTTQAKFGKTSIYQDSSDDSFGVATHADFNLGSQDWTLDFWWYPDSLQSDYYFLHTVGTHNMLCLYYPSNGGFKILHSNPTSWQIGVIGGEGSISAGQWSHIAFVHASGANSVYLNGEVIAGPTTDTADVTGANASVNANSGYVKGNFEGYVDEYRLSVGIARWTDDFVPPNKPYSVIGDDSVLEGARDSVNFWGIRGGTHTNYNRYGVKTFTSSGTFTTKVPVKCDFLIVAGGGGGGTSGTYGSGGGGAGGLIYDTAVISPGSYTVTIGAGGAVGVSGDNTTFNSNTSIGGGHGGHGSGQGSSTGANGGSGGGSCYPGSSTETGFTAGIDTWSVGTAGGLGTAGQGNYGGRGESTHGHGSGGGGAGGKGWNYGYNSDYPTPNNGAGGNGHGGVGLQYSISGTATYYAGGGGGGGYGGYGNAGTGGGGSGGSTGTNAGASPASSVAGTPNTGGGGGGGMTSEPSSAGGSGIVVVRWEIL